MKTFLYSLGFVIIGGLGLFGLLSMFMPSQKTVILTQLFIIALIMIIGLFFFRRLAEWTGHGDQTRYKRAARQSRKRRQIVSLHHKTHMLRSTSPKFKVIKNNAHSAYTRNAHQAKKQSHLTVIEGRKNKKRKRLLF
ncbi:hypothetical protein [Sporolactobacillus terrae]|uniref:Uncharacterized protein n=1 Tax=Sporolactobacillus terrae TaxID=269673 RepID=A0A410D9H8_9BACL|nr:hypothetical protein [Sporolactobacillus terrae]QAA22740.1 hypothetical protein C0674_08940 [Sporolactobacillus terrae]QAA25713.1 hypothetical protein C0679_08920 [Sporolactobacillus terrae]UAK17526.1 hypothetical protein K7399_06255 [Sporolactobacillus terrae]BBN99076.1 hypothetical protein St703_17810 [Sporolactobacillus terrae]